MSSPWLSYFFSKKLSLIFCFEYETCNLIPKQILLWMNTKVYAWQRHFFHSCIFPHFYRATHLLFSLFLKILIQLSILSEMINASNGQCNSGTQMFLMVEFQSDVGVKWNTTPISVLLLASSLCYYFFWWEYIEKRFLKFQLLWMYFQLTKLFGCMQNIVIYNWLYIPWLNLVQQCRRVHLELVMQWNSKLQT